jgi:hypothetical protein
MILVTINKSKALLYLRFVGHVRVSDVDQSLADVADVVRDLPPGFRLLTDLTGLDSMDLGCQAGIGKTMELLDQKGMSAVIRVIPEPHKDIGFNILTALHYRRHIHAANCRSLEEAAQMLGL